jgi:hypothetical protein
MENQQVHKTNIHHMDQSVLNQVDSLQVCPRNVGRNAFGLTTNLRAVEELRGDIVRLTERMSEVVASNSDLLCERRKLTALLLVCTLFLCAVRAPTTY